MWPRLTAASCYKQKNGGNNCSWDTTGFKKVLFLFSPVEKVVCKFYFCSKKTQKCTKSKWIAWNKIKWSCGFIKFLYIPDTNSNILTCIYLYVTLTSWGFILLSVGPLLLDTTVLIFLPPLYNITIERDNFIKRWKRHITL